MQKYKIRYIFYFLTNTVKKHVNGVNRYRHIIPYGSTHRYIQGKGKQKTQINQNIKQKRTDKHATEKKERKKKERNCYH